MRKLNFGPAKSIGDNQAAQDIQTVQLCPPWSISHYWRKSDLISQKQDLAYTRILEEETEKDKRKKSCDG